MAGIRDEAVGQVVDRLAPVLARTLVALDFDGTLAPIVRRPEDARPLPGTTAVLERLARRVERLALVSGRPAVDLIELSGVADIPGIVVYGHYGLERWYDGALHSPAHVPGVTQARSRVTDLVQACAVRDDGLAGVVVEDKGHSIAVHTRRAADPAAALEMLRPELARIAGESGLELAPGRLVFELRPAGVDKGHAVRALAADPPVAGVLYAGDDVGDVPAVEAVRGLQRAGAVGVVVCSDSDEPVPEFRDRADLVVPGPPGVLAVLEALADS